MSVLAVDPTAPWFIKAAAESLLVLHIGGGGLGMASGATALVAKKGGRLHSLAGKVFFAAMLTMAGIGATVTPFLTTFFNESPNVIAGIMTLYLLVTSWATIRRRDGRIGRLEIAGLATAITICAAGLSFILMAANSPTGTIGTTPPQAFYVFLLVGAISATCDLKIIIKGRISGPSRIARHLWRMCVALTIGSGSFFLGQQQLLPAFVRGTAWQFAPVFVPLAAMAFWLIRVQIPALRLWIRAILPRPATTPLP